MVRAGSQTHDSSRKGKSERIAYNSTSQMASEAAAMEKNMVSSVSSITSGVVDAAARATSPMSRIEARIVLDMLGVSTNGPGETDFRSLQKLRLVASGEHLRKEL